MPKSDQGVQTKRYQIIPRVLIFIFDGDRVLLIKGAPNKRLWAN
jgi:8-oxo-dGTP diphosphatase